MVKKAGEIGTPGGHHFPLRFSKSFRNHRLASIGANAASKEPNGQYVGTSAKEHI